MITPNEVAGVARRAGFEVADEITLPGRTGTSSPIPSDLHARIMELHEENYPQGLYGHQSLAIEAALDGKNVCLATSTVSGKSLVFTSLAANILLSDTRARVIAMYPRVKREVAPVL